MALEQESNRSLRRLAPVVYLIGITVVLYLLFNNRAYDDPFITYRYAINLQQGQGFVYNPGEKVLSTTTPLFTLLLAFLGKLFPDLLRLANIVGSLSLALGALAMWDLSRTWKTPLLGWTALCLYPTFGLLAVTLSSETPLYLLLCIGVFCFYARGKYDLAALSAALAVLARPDGLLLPAIVAIDFLLRIRKPVPWRALALFILITAAWFGFAWLYFGSPLPATLMAKQQQGSMAMSQRFAAGFASTVKTYLGWPYILEALFAVVGIFSLFVKDRAWILFEIWMWLYFLAYSILGVSRYFWYYAPLVPGFIVLVGLGVQTSCRWLASINTRLSRLPLVVFLPLLIIIQVYFLWGLHNAPDHRYGIYRAAGEWLAERTPENTTVGALEVGIIGYYARRPMVDFSGLIQPAIAQQLTENTTYEDAAIWAVDRYHPDYLVLHDGIFPRLEQGFVSSHCHPLQRFSGEQYQYTSDLVIYSCLEGYSLR